MQPLLLSLLHFGKLGPSKVPLVFFIDYAERWSMMWLGPSARALLAYMSEASLKKGPAWGLSTTLDAGRLGAGRLDAGRFGCGSSITLIIYAIVKTPGG